MAHVTFCVCRLFFKSITTGIQESTCPFSTLSSLRTMQTWLWPNSEGLWCRLIEITWFCSTGGTGAPWTEGAERTARCRNQRRKGGFVNLHKILTCYSQTTINYTLLLRKWKRQVGVCDEAGDGYRGLGNRLDDNNRVLTKKLLCPGKIYVVLYLSFSFSLTLSLI